MTNQFIKCGVLLTLYLTVVTASEAKNMVQTLSNKILPKKSENNVILGGNRDSFHAALKGMDEALNMEYTPCSLFQPTKPFLPVEGRRVSEIKCLQHIWDVKVEEETKKKMDLCQATSGQQLLGIVGGRKSKPREFPHLGALGWKTEEGKYAFKCGSFLVSNRFALTAAHCQYDEDKKHPKIVRFGVINISNEKINSHQSPQDMKIQKFIKHPCYRPNFKAFDIAVVELASRVTFNDYVQPACILNQEVNQAIISGWGYTDELDAKISEELQTAQVDVLPFKTCRKKWKAKRDKQYWPMFLKSQMCAVKMTGKVADICGGDSGGPLQSVLNVNTNRTIYNVIGVTSLNSKCGSLNFPSVFTRVSSYVDWIEEVVWGVNSKPENVKSECGINENNKKTSIENTENIDRQTSQPSDAKNVIDTTDNEIPKDRKHTSVKEEIVKINDVQNFDKGTLFWFDSTHATQWVYIDKSELERNSNF